MLNAIFRPVENWPREKTGVLQRRRAPFKAKNISRLDLLERELNHLGAQSIVVQAFLQPRDVRNDGWPRSGARPSEPGVILSFQNRQGDHLSYPCDTYTDWDDNLYAIALSLEALRAVDRYGVTKGNEQYQGFKKLEAPSVIDPKMLAESFICQHASISLEDLRADLNGAYKAAACKLHPDYAGDDELFKQLQEHMRVLRQAKENL